MYYSEKGPYKRGRGGQASDFNHSVPKAPLLINDKLSLTQAITFENSAVLVHGYMEESTYHPLLNISVIPQVNVKK